MGINEHKRDEESPLWSSPRSDPQKESPWLKDQRRAPRSVRTPPSYNSNSSIHSHSHRGKRRLPKPNFSGSNKSKSHNPFDSPLSPSVGNRSPPIAAPVSRNPSPSEGDHRTAMNAGRTNPFDSPTPVRKSVGARNNPFDESPASSVGQPPKRHGHPRSAAKQVLYNPFDPATGSGAGGVDSPYYPQVKVTVHTQQDVRPTKQQGSVAVDSLDQILDVTEETTTADESEDAGERLEENGREEWSDEPFPHHRQLSEAHRGYPSELQQQEQMFYPQTPPPLTPTPSNFSSALSRNGYSEDGTHTTATPSEKALMAAETLKKSFQQRRRQKKEGARGILPTTIDEQHEERVPRPNQKDSHDKTPVSEDGRPDGLGKGKALAGVAAKRRAEADAKQSTAPPPFVGDADPTKRIPQTESQPTRNPTTGDQNVGASPVQAAGSQQQQEQQPRSNQRAEQAAGTTSANGNYTLHDLCDEAVGTDDLAWHNALYLLTIRPDLGGQIEPECKMTPLHVACLAQTAPPIWITRGLLYASPGTCRQPDTGGRLPLHLLVATTADLDTIRLLVEEYPPSVAHRDDRGFTPLQLLLKRNDFDGLLTLEHLRLLLGQDVEGIRRKPKNRLLFRRGDHLKSDLRLQDLEWLAEERHQRHESTFREYPDDVRRALTKLSQWKRRQANKQVDKNNGESSGHFADEEFHFLQSRMADFVNPASIPTPTGQLLPLHLLVRRSFHSDTGTPRQNLHSIKRAGKVDLLRVLIAAFPQGLVAVDANGKTPIMTAMLQKNAPPSEEVVDLLLGLRTPGVDGRNDTRRPALIPTADTLQTPLHVAAEEFVSNYSLLSTVCEAYPDARTVQDAWGRTPLHLAFQNYRSVPIDEATLELLFVKPVAKIEDNEGKTPLDFLLENPACVIREPSKLRKDDRQNSGMVFQDFFDASVERPRNRSEARDFLARFQKFPPWLRRQACAARFVQDILVEEIASPFTTFRILGSGIVLALLLVALRRMLHMDPDYTLLIYYLASYHLVMQLIQWGIAIHMGEFFRLCLSNIWRWFDLATVALSISCALYVSREIIDTDDGIGVFFPRLGASATIACWLSLVGYFLEWSCGLAVFIGSATQLLSVLFWPLFLAAIGFLATSQVLFTLEDCSDGGNCSLLEYYTLIYRTILGQPVLTDSDYDLSPGTSTLLVIFSILCIWWILSIIAMVVTEAGRLDRRQLALAWYWEPKVALTVMTSAATTNKNEKTRYHPSLVENYCDLSEKYWHIFESALRGERSDVHWDALCFRSTTMLFLTGFMALFLLPIWFFLGLVSLGLLWPPQIRRWVFCPRPASSTIFNRGSRAYAPNEEDPTRTKVSQLRTDVMHFKATTYDQNDRIQKDLAVIKDIIFRASMDGEERPE